ncbi:molybdopterin converting factor subunit 1 [Orrella sp. 11846]|uniref:molybdopterin converting factor subunit 1 n=1 Tax=Orrella sp. 11846 TaxID=3409913 RepID=UPI003B59AFD0
MTITILFFGELREQLGRSDETLELSADTVTVQDLIDQLTAQGEPWSQAFSSQYPLQVAVNQEMAQMSSAIPDKAEIAFFRPVTGG